MILLQKKYNFALVSEPSVMNMEDQVKQHPDFDDAAGIVSDCVRHLVLHNDDVHTFDYVISSLMDVCHHDPYQAEQCVCMVHFKGRCDVKSGTYDELCSMKEQLKRRELIVTID